MFCLYCYWSTCSCEQHKTIELFHGNARWVLLPPPLSNKICCTAFNHINVPWYLCEVPSTCSISPKFGVSQQLFIKVPKIQFHESPFSAGRIDTDRQTDRHADMAGLIGTFSLHIRIPQQQIWMAFKEITEQTQSSGHLTAQPNDQKKTVKPNIYNSQTDPIFCPLSVHFR